ncbi:histone-lysine N-methyltransferase SMYD3-like [Limulus polyphemus]|uniref:Histone-lysine N-methyltransferase SMYD3-like n=1 Tax=Limulus polyphemus TaxID=6850 RepID=A0ABM1BE95_LIMPO|nr:histone-lysine N-methyltransferase SMYD3-like [Limulus polyphemus]
MNRSKTKKGSLLLSSQPFVHILDKNQRAKRCEYCFQGITTVFRCSSCRYVYYCNKECQKLAWIDHKRECNNIRKISPNVPPDNLRVLARIILKLQVNCT